MSHLFNGATLRVISDCDLYLYWVSVVLRTRSFTVRLKTRIHLTHLFWVYHWVFLLSFLVAPLLWFCPFISVLLFFVEQHHLCTAIMGIAQSFCRSLHKYTFHHPVVNIIYALLLWVSPKVSVAVYTNMFSSSSIELRTNSDFGLREWRSYGLISRTSVRCLPGCEPCR